MNRKFTRNVTRRELYDLIWQRPMWKVAPEFGLSGNGLAKLCRREGIPVPERGYWAQVAHGKRVKKSPLQSPAGRFETLVIEATPSNRIALESSMPAPLTALLRAERGGIEPIAVPASPKPHPLVEAWPKPQKPSYGVAPFTTEAESRGRRIASVLFREVERRGGSLRSCCSQRLFCRTARRFLAKAIVSLSLGFDGYIAQLGFLAGVPQCALSRVVPLAPKGTSR